MANWKHEGGKNAGSINLTMDLVCFDARVQETGVCFYFHGRKKTGTSHHLVVRTPRYEQDSIRLSELLTCFTGVSMEPSDAALITERDLQETIKGTQIVAGCHIPDRKTGQRGVCLVLDFFLNPEKTRWIRPHDNAKRNIIPICMLPDYELTPAAPKKSFKDILDKRRAEVTAYNESEAYKLKSK